MIALLISLVVVVISLGLVVWNLLRKVEKYEEDIELKNEFIKKFQELSEASMIRIREIDSNGAFESDDEVGYFFNNLKDIILSINTYFKNYIK